LPQGGGQVLQELAGIHGGSWIHTGGVLSLLLKALLGQHLLLDIGREGGQELGINLCHHTALVGSHEGRRGGRLVASTGQSPLFLQHFLPHVFRQGSQERRVNPLRYLNVAQNV